MELRTTILPRKTVWEENQLRKTRTGDESEWLEQEGIFENQISKLASERIKGIRLVVLPFEICKEEGVYDWTAWERSIEITNWAGMRIDLSAGPLDYPYGPEGIRLPNFLTGQIREVAKESRFEAEIGLGRSLIVRRMEEFGLEYFEKLINKYGNDGRIDKIFIGNEWPDRHLIEGVRGEVNFSKQYMMKLVEIAMAGSDKKIAFNTNIHPTNISRIKYYFEEIFQLLGKRGVLGIDAYPTRESWWQKRNYGQKIENIRKMFPETEIVFTELQAEPWPGKGWAGRSWKDIFENQPDMIEDYYENFFGRQKQTYVVSSGISEIGLWGAPLWLVADKLGYKGHWEEIRKYEKG